MKRRMFLKWLAINGLCFAGAFFVVFLLVGLFPDAMLKFLGGWASLIELAGAKKAAQFSSDFELFLHILIRNSISIGITAIIALLLQSPILMLAYGAFYSLIAFLAPLTLGEALPLGGWITIADESLFLILCASLVSALATEVFGVKPEWRDYLGYWKQGWKRLLPPKKDSWRNVLGRHRRALAFFALIILVMLLFGAWFEVWGY